MTENQWLTFDPIVLVMDVVKRWLVIAAVTAMVCVGTFIVSHVSYEPVYQTATTFVVTAKGSSTTVISNLTSTSSVASVFSDLLNSSMMRKYILEELGTTHFDGEITASVIAETNLLNVRVKASDPRTAYIVAQAIIEHHEKLTYRVVDGVSIEVLMRPTVPVRPVNSNNAAGLMRKSGLLTAIGVTAAIFLFSFFQDKIRSGKEARSKLPCSFLGEIGHEKKHRSFSAWLRRKKTSILICNPLTSFRFVETFRKLRHRVEQRMHGGKVLMVTSLLENEGKSTVAVNLAISMAQKKGKVLLIDCDLRKPACMNLLEHRNFSHTVTEVITGKTAPENALERDKRSGLYLMLEKKSHNRSGDLLASESMAELINWARAHFDFVVLDLPPMAEVSDAETAAKHADASLLVIRQNLVPTPVIKKALTILEKSEARFLGCVLNNVHSSALFSGSGAGYGYGRYGKYGHYGHYGNYHTKSGAKN